MKIIHLKNRITDGVRNRIEYWLNESDTYTVAIVMSGVFMLMILGGLLLVLFLVGQQLHLNDNPSERETVMYDDVHVVRYHCQIPSSFTTMTENCDMVFTGALQCAEPEKTVLNESVRHSVREADDKI